MTSGAPTNVRKRVTSNVRVASNTQKSLLIGRNGVVCCKNKVISRLWLNESLTMAWHAITIYNKIGIKEISAIPIQYFKPLNFKLKKMMIKMVLLKKWSKIW